MHTEIRQMEERLRSAVLSGNVVELDALIDDRLLFVGPDGGVYSKADDLELHRSGAERITRFDLEEVLIELHGATAIAIVQANLAGVFKGQAFDGHYRYIRTWLRKEQSWRIVAGSVCALPALSSSSAATPQ
jgi:ketosteroid isomerase-like protein